MINTTQTLEDGTSANITVCAASVDGDDVRSSLGVDMILGDAFLRNAYVSYVTFSQLL